MESLVGVWRIAAGTLAALCFSTAASANLITYSGAGSDLNVATLDGMGNVVVGITTLMIPVTEPTYVVDPGDSVILSLTGLQYPFAGDLRVTLSVTDAASNVLVLGDVFNRIGLTNPADPSDFGYGTQFGDSFTIDSGNYVFCPPTGCPNNTGYNGSPTTGDLWTTAAPLGSNDSIPSGNYAPTTSLSDAYDGLDMMFGGVTVPTNGFWVLTIFDYFPPFSGGGAAFTPGIQSWGLTVQATDAAALPEPSTALSIPLALGFLWLLRRVSSR
jgi:hypothetical protein